ncbi:MAG: RidA family protein [Actinomycetota bacterium]
MSETSAFIRSNHAYGGWTSEYFSDVAVVGGSAKMLFLSGVGAEDSLATDSRAVSIQAPGDFAGQTRIAFEKVKKILAHHGATMGDIVRMATYVTDAAQIRTYFEIQRQALGDVPPPPHTFLQVAALAEPDMLVEVEVTAAVPIRTASSVTSERASE